MLTTFLWLLLTLIQRQDPYEVGKASCALLPVSFLTSAPSARRAVGSWALALLVLLSGTPQPPRYPRGSPRTHFQSPLECLCLRPPCPLSHPLCLPSDRISFVMCPVSIPSEYKLLRPFPWLFPVLCHWYLQWYPLCVGGLINMVEE